MFYRFIKALATAVFALWFRVKVEGAAHIPPSGGCVLVSNHRSYIDPVFLIDASRRKIRFMAKQEAFRNRFMGAVLRWMGVFPVSRGTGDSGAIATAVNIVREGGILGIFPEGHRSKAGGMLAFKSGAALIAAQSGGDVVPACVKFEGKLRFRRRVTVRFGEVIPNSVLCADGGHKAATRMMKDAVAALLERT